MDFPGFHRIRWAVWCALVLFSARAVAQGDATNDTAAATTANTNSIPLKKAPEAVLQALFREDTFNGVTEPVLRRIAQVDHTNGFLGFLNDWHLRPKIFQGNGGVAEAASLGFEFDYKKALASTTLRQSSRQPIGFSLAIEAKGDVAFDADRNPNNLLESSVGLHLFQGIGGIDPLYSATKEAQTNLQRLIMASTTNQAAYIQAAKEFTAHMRPQFFYDLQAQVGFETDQQFHDKQWAYGGKLALVFRDWRADSEVGWFNVFDYPFAAFRALANKEKFQPSGRTFPSVVVGLDLVDPTGNDSRQAIDADDAAYPRLRVEVGFKTPVLRWREEQLYVSAAFRHFQELGASSAIQSADMDRSDYFVVKVDLPYKFNISYSTGRLPLDRSDDQVYAVGWTLNF